MKYREHNRIELIAYKMTNCQLQCYEKSEFIASYTKE